MLLGKQLLSYGIIGLLNTAITVVAVGTLTLFGWNNILSNAAGFGLGLLNSFIMNRRFTFSSKSNSPIFPFMFSFFFAYGANLAVLLSTSRLSALHDLVPQTLALLTYNVIFFLLMKLWVFNSVYKADSL